MTSPWDRRIDRARKLISDYPAAAELLAFYVEIARFQKSVFDALSAGQGSLEQHFGPLLALVRRIGPEPLKSAANDLENTDLLADAPDRPDTHQFFAHVLLQPFTEFHARRNGVGAMATGSICPYCGEKPQAAVLREEGDGGKRWLVCWLCSSEWEFRRVLCPGCGEESLDRLPVYTTPAFENVRIEACDTCRVYIKSFDLTKNALAIPAVDDLATTPLNIWAEENGYRKLQPNLLGM